MTSMLRSYAVPPVLPVKFHALESPAYYDNVIGRELLFPFTYSNGVLDIQYIDNFEADMVISTGNSPSTEPDGGAQLLGGTSLVQSLGPKFKEYITAWRNPDSGTPINIYIKGAVQKVQYTLDIDVESSVVQTSTAPPSGDNFTIGSQVNNFRTTWIFKTPLTFTTVESGITQYITFTSKLDED